VTYYIMGEVTVRSPEWIRPYVADINAFIAKHGGRVLSRSVNMETFEGREALPTNVVLIAFPSREAAAAFFDDPAYRPLRDQRRSGSHSAFIGFPAEDLAV